MQELLSAALRLETSRTDGKKVAAKKATKLLSNIERAFTSPEVVQEIDLMAAEGRHTNTATSKLLQTAEEVFQDRQKRRKLVHLSQPRKASAAEPDVATYNPDEPAVTHQTEPTVMLQETPGLLQTLRGEDVDFESDVTIAGVNCEKLLRKLTCDLILDDQQDALKRTFSKLLRTSILDGAVLVNKFPDPKYMRYISEDDYDKVYAELAGNHQIWDHSETSRSQNLRQACRILEAGLVGGESFDNLTLPTIDPVFFRTMSTLFPCIITGSQDPESEASWAATFVLPFLDSLRIRRWRIYLDTTMANRMRPDLSIKSGEFTMATGELKSPYAQSSTRKLQLAEGLSRAKVLLKKHVITHNWQTLDPMLITMIAPDGDTFHVYKVLLWEKLFFFVELGCVPIISSIYNVDRLERALTGFAKIRDLLEQQEPLRALLTPRTVLSAPPKLPSTPSSKALMRTLRTVHPMAVSPETTVRRKSLSSQMVP
ncbi:hypothetical protein HDU88_005489 [Geranomyces variabilis]|nr:hypothetical protein HDU88_005489 [Geranomyces variabilis]